MDPATIAAGIQAGSSLLGGILGRNKATKPGDIVRATRAGILGQASGARLAGERYGFNPMALLGVSQPIVPAAADNSMMGQGIANAGLAVAQGINEASAQRAYLEQLEEQNKELRRALDGQTLRPKVPGIYGQRVPQAGVAGSVQAERLDVSGDFIGPRDVARDEFGKPLGKPGELDSRSVEINAVQNEPWFKEMEIFGKTVNVWNDEASDSELAALGTLLTIPFQIGWQDAKESYRLLARDAKAGFKQRPSGAAEPDPAAIQYNQNWVRE